MVRKGVESDSKFLALSTNQKQILNLLVKEHLTPAKIAISKGVTLSAVYKTITKIRKKGYLSKGYTRGLKKSESTSLKNKKAFKGKYIRLHGQEFNCSIIYKSAAYTKQLKKKNVVYVDSNTIRLYKDSIEIYGSPHLSFYGQDEQRATSVAFQYWNKIFNQVEQRLGILIVKGFSTQIKQVNAHYAEVDNELAKEYNEKKVKLMIFGTEDGKAWFTLDFSKSEHEAEAIHPLRSKADISKTKAFFNDIRDNAPPTITELFKIISGNIQVTNQNTNFIKEYAQNIHAHTKAIQKMAELLDKIERRL